MRITPGPFVGHGWQLIGGHLALDLVNTVSWQCRPDRVTDRLRDPAHLADWLAVAAPRHGYRCTVTPAELGGISGEATLSAVRELRDVATAAFAARVDQRPAPVAAVRSIRDSYYRALAAAEVAPRLPLRHHVQVESPGQIQHLLGLAVGELSSQEGLGRLRRCADGDCGWFFLDTSRNRSRRWCDPGDCGNRNRVRAFATRART